MLFKEVTDPPFAAVGQGCVEASWEFFIFRYICRYFININVDWEERLPKKEYGVLILIWKGGGGVLPGALIPKW